MSGRLFDISPPLSPGTAVFPGDTPLSREVLLDTARGDAITLSTLRATVHLGAHVDAPSHYGPAGPSVDRLPLEVLLGRCRVVRPDLRGTAGPETTAVDGAGGQAGPLVTEAAIVRCLGPREPGSRLLIATGTHPDRTSFPHDFAALDPSLVRWLAARGVQLIGIDTPSVDPADSKELPAHAACLETGVTILEGIVLDGVPEGEYELIALPLRLEGFDASPVRAVLREF